MTDFEKEKQRLLEIHDNNRLAHVERDADALVAYNVDGYIHVVNGNISRRSREEMRQSYSGYLGKMLKYEWDDLESPIIQISDDATMAWLITRTRVRQTLQDESGEIEREFIYAGIVTYAKQNGDWMRTTNVATFEHTPEG